MTIKSLRILVQIDFPGHEPFRMHDGSGPLLDLDGNVWAGASLTDGLDQIESAMNGEASTLMLSVSGVDPAFMDLAYEDLEMDAVIGGKVQLMIQECDEWDQPIDAPRVKFTGIVDNMPSEENATDEGIVGSIVLEVTNRFNLRTLVSGSVLSDVDQKARSQMINPGAPADRFAERIHTLIDKVIVWPRFS